jgi:hypothetical protein
MQIVVGECLHGRALFSLGRSVLFHEPCPDCQETLEAEGYEVVGPQSRPLLQAA